jgi:hypothetical protein
MRNPIPVTVRTITIDNGSTRSSTGASNEPTEIQSKSRTVTGRPLSGIPIHTRTPTTNDAPTSAAARPPATRRSGFPARRRSTAPASGSAGTTQITSVMAPGHRTCRGAC